MLMRRHLQAMPSDVTEETTLKEAINIRKAVTEGVDGLPACKKSDDTLPVSFP